MKVSVFENLYSDKPFTQDVGTILERFKSDDRYNISEMADLSKDERDKRKKFLPVVTFAGVFSKRAKSALVQASGFAILDFDDVEPNEIKEVLSKDKYCYSAFISPSGNGVKALIRIGAVTSDFEYKQYYKAIAERYDLDESGKDISRACFFCYDPGLWVNEEAKVMQVQLQQPKKRTPAKQVDNVRNDYSLASKACEVIRHAQEGERHTKILSASRLLGGYVAANRISYNEAERILLQEANLKNEDWRDNQKAVEDGLKNGMASPLPVDQLDKAMKREESVIKYGKIYYTLRDKRDEVLDLYANGQQKGYTIGLQSVDSKYSLKLGTTTYLYAAPYTGKTQWWFWYLVQQSKTHGLKHAIFSPETGTAKEVFAELVQIAAQRDFYKTYNNQMTEEERDAAMKFVDTYFIVVDPSHKVITYKDFFNYLDEIERVYNVKLHTATIDPFNEFRQDLREFNGRQDLYLESVLSEVRENARTNDRHNCIITHVQNQQVVTVDNIRFYPMPTYREIAGGQAWSRKGMSMIALWRPKDGLCDPNGEPYPPNCTVLEVQKSKPKGVGEIGRVNLIYEIDKHSYIDEHGYAPTCDVSGKVPPSKYSNETTDEDDPPF